MALNNYPDNVSGREPEIMGMSANMENWIESHWPEDVVAFLTEEVSPDEEDWPTSDEARSEKIFEILAEQYNDDEPDYD